MKKTMKALDEMTAEEYAAYLRRTARKQPAPRTLLGWLRRDLDGAL